VTLAPSHVRKLSVETKGTHDLRLTWIEPETPNGNITHYVVTWSIINEDEAAFEKRNYCVERRYCSTVITAVLYSTPSR